MASLTGDWDDIIGKAEEESFVGREQELILFRQEINCVPPRYLVFYITGQGGVGETTLLNRYKEIARGSGFLLADCNELQHDVPAVLGRFAHQLAEQGITFKSFDERYKVYRQKMHEIENDPEAPQGLAALIGRTVVRVAYIGGDLLPGIRKGLEYFPRETIETQASEWATYLAKKFSDKDEVVLVREPIAVLTPLFFKDLNEAVNAKSRRVLLCFENFEATRHELQEWLLRLREYKPSQNIRIAIAGRDQPGAKWDTLRKVTLTVRLDVFTEQEAEDFLDVYNIRDENRRREILGCSGRLPVLMSWLAAPAGQGFDPTVPTHDIVERFLRWVPEPTLRQAALLAALPRTFNIDILKMVFSSSEQSVDLQAAFNWLLSMPFVQQHSDGWQYHSVVRRMMLRYQKQKSPQTYQNMHMVLADFYNSKRGEISISIGEEWSNEDWRACTLAYMYHFLAADPIQHWNEFISLFTVALRKRRAFAIELIELLNSEDVHDELSRDQIDIAQLFKEQLYAIEKGGFKDGFAMFNKLCTISGLSSQAKCYAFAYRGRAYQLMEKYEEALADFNQAIALDEKDAWAIAHRGWVYRWLERYEEALADFNAAIALEEKYIWAINRHGETCGIMGRYEEALADFNCAIALSEKDVDAITGRGWIYRLLERYEEALADFDRAIALNGKYFWAIGWRGVTYREMERYEEALADFDRAIALNGEIAWAFVERGVTYREMERYEEALADFDRAIALNGEIAWAFVERGVTYLWLEHYENALADLNRAIALDEKDAYLFLVRGRTYQSLERYEEALADFDRAIALDEKDALAIARRGETYRRMERYEEALADFDRAISLNEKYAWAFAQRGETYRLLKRYEEALANFDHAIALGGEDAFAFAQRGLTYRSLKRYEEALADLKLAIALGREDAYEIEARGWTYRWLEQYEEAVADFDRVIALDEKDALAIARRGETYRLLKRYEEALADLNHAIALGGEDATAFAWRGVTYQDMKRYEEALADFDHVIALGGEVAWAIAQRGWTYRLLKRYEEALADLNHAIALGEENAGAFAARGEIYRLLSRYEKAVADFDRAIALDKKNAFAFACRGETYRLLGRYEEALADFDRLIVLDEKEDWNRYKQALVYLTIGRKREFEDALHTAIELAQSKLHDDPNNLTISFNLALYNLVYGNSLARYEELISTCSSIVHLQDAIDDLDDFLTIEPSNELALRVRSRLQANIERLEGGCR